MLCKTGRAQGQSPQASWQHEQLKGHTLILWWNLELYHWGTWGWSRAGWVLLVSFCLGTAPKKQPKSGNQPQPAWSDCYNTELQPSAGMAALFNDLCVVTALHPHRIRSEAGVQDQLPHSHECTAPSTSAKQATTHTGLQAWDVICTYNTGGIRKQNNFELSHTR